MFGQVASRIATCMEKTMIKNKIIYIVLIVYSAVLAVLYNEYMMLLVFLVLASIPFVLFSLLLYTRSKIKVQMGLDLLVVNKGDNIGISISVMNQSRLPISYMRLSLIAYNGFAKQKSKIKISGFVDGKSQQILHCNLASSHCGNIEIRCQNIQLYDYFRLFSLKKTIKETLKITVLPEPYEIENQIQVDQSKVMIDSDVFSKTKSGDDPSEVYAIRGYQQGDKLHRIHWKLSTKKKQFLVKEYSLPVGCTVCILVEFYYDGNEKERLDYIDGLLETILSLSYSLIQCECTHNIAWYDIKQDEFRQAKVSKEEDVYTVVEELLQLHMYKQIGKVIELQQVFCSQDQLTNLYYVGTDFSLEQGELLREMYQGVHINMIHINNSDMEIEKKTLIDQLEGLLIRTTLLDLVNLEMGIKTLEI